MGRGEWTVRCTVGAFTKLEREEENLTVTFDSDLDRFISLYGEREVFDPIWERMVELFAEHGLERHQKILCVVEYITEFAEGQEMLVPTKITEVKPRRLHGWINT